MITCLNHDNRINQFNHARLTGRAGFRQFHSVLKLFTGFIKAARTE